VRNNPAVIAAYLGEDEAAVVAHETGPPAVTTREEGRA
jgi:branched-subunit amino acid ATP-binding cassette transporter